MKKTSVAAVIGLTVLLALILFCPRMGGYGSISGQMTWLSEKKPCWPPDTCVTVCLFKGDEKVVAVKKPCPIWPPDTCNFMFEKLAYGEYKVAVMENLTGVLVGEGKHGSSQVVKYYTNGKDSVAIDSTYASIIRLDRKNPNATSVNIMVW